MCKFAPYRICYHLGESGRMRRIQGAQPVNIYRVYKRSIVPDKLKV